MSFSLFGWGSSTTGPSSDELPAIFPMPFGRDLFVEIDVINIFQKILTDVMERTHGLSDEQQEILFDNCVASEANQGLISHVARAMAFKKELFLVYEKALNVLRLATPTEQQQIRDDYAKSGQSGIGIFISFAKYLKADLVALYSLLEYLTVSHLHKSMNLSTAIQYKVNELRASVALLDKDAAKLQAVNVNSSLGKGLNVYMDAKDEIITLVPDLTAVKESVEYLNEKRSFYLGLPCSYLNGEKGSSGLSDTGEGDARAIERGLKNYYFSIMKPILEALFGEDVELSYKSQDFRNIDSAMNVLKTFALVDEEIISLDNKTLIMNRLLDLPEDEEGDGPDPVEVLTPEQIGVNNTQPVI